MYFDLNLKHLKVFYYVAKHLSFTRAAQELFVTQPAVAMQIDALEKHYGVRFFTRHKRQLALTEAGEALYEYAERIMQMAFEAHRTILDMKEYPSGVLKMGTTKTWARYLMPTYILRFQKLFPEIQIELQDGSSEDMAMSVIYGQNDVAIVARVPFDSRLGGHPLPRQGERRTGAGGPPQAPSGQAETDLPARDSRRAAHHPRPWLGYP